MSSSFTHSEHSASASCLSASVLKSDGRWGGSGVHALTTKPDNWSSVPRTHTVDGENRLSEVVLRPPHAFCGIHACAHAHTLNKCNRKGVIQNTNDSCPLCGWPTAVSGVGLQMSCTQVGACVQALGRLALLSYSSLPERLAGWRQFGRFSSIHEGCVGPANGYKGGSLQ